MAAVFGCCKNKTCANWCCVQCLSIFHPSCLERSKDLIKLGLHRIICSRECELMKVKSDKIHDLHVQEIQNLKQQIHERDERIIKLERDAELERDVELNVTEITVVNEELNSDEGSSTADGRRGMAGDSEDEVAEADAGSLCETRGCQIKMDGMKLEMARLLESCNLLRGEIAEIADRNARLERELQEYEEIKNSMLTSIETLTAERDFCLEDMKSARLELFTMKKELIGSKDHSNVKPIISTPVVDKKIRRKQNLIETNKVRNRVIVLTDDFGKTMYNQLAKKLVNSGVQLICKPFARYKDLVYTADCYIRDLTQNDYVIFLAGLNDVNIRISDIILLANKCFQTNLIISNLPFVNNIKAGKNIFHINHKLSSVVERLKRFSINIDFLDISDKFSIKDFLYSKYYLNRRGLSKLATLIRASMDNFCSNLSTNLKYITPLKPKPNNAPVIIDQVADDDTCSNKGSHFLVQGITV